MNGQTIMLYSSPDAMDPTKVPLRNMYSLQRVEIEAGEIVYLVIINVKQIIVTKIIIELVNISDESIHIQYGDKLDKLLIEKVELRYLRRL